LRIEIMDTKIKPSFWSDPVVDALPPEGKLALLWLFTSRVSACGWCPATKRHFEFETGSPYQALLDAVKALGKGCVTHAKGFWIRNYIRHQIGVGDRLARNNMRFPILNALVDVPEEIRALIFVEYECLQQGLAKPLHSGAPPQEQSRAEKRREEGMQGEKQKRAPAATDEQWLAGLAANSGYAGLDVPTEFAKAGVWCETHRRKCSRQFFVGWLNRAERPMVPAAINGTKRPTYDAQWAPKDDRWKSRASDCCLSPRKEDVAARFEAGDLPWAFLYGYEQRRVAEAMREEYPEAWT